VKRSVKRILKTIVDLPAAITAIAAAKQRADRCIRTAASTMPRETARTGFYPFWLHLAAASWT
jgi:hypothetical protein